MVVILQISFSSAHKIADEKEGIRPEEKKKTLYERKKRKSKRTREIRTLVDCLYFQNIIPRSLAFVNQKEET